MNGAAPEEIMSCCYRWRFMQSDTFIDTALIDWRGFLGIPFSPNTKDFNDWKKSWLGFVFFGLIEEDFEFGDF